MSLRGGLQPDEAISNIERTTTLKILDCFVVPTGLPRNDTIQQHRIL